MKKMILLMAVLATLAGCNTVAGVGDDVSGGARTVQGWLLIGPQRARAGLRRPLQPQSPAPKAGPMFNLAAHVLAKGQETPEKLALVVLGLTGAERWSYARLTAAVRGCGGWLGEHAAPGDRILIRAGNTPAFPVVYLGAIAAGMVPVATSAAADRARDHPHGRAVRPRLIVAEPGLAVAGRTPYGRWRPARLGGGTRPATGTWAMRTAKAMSSSPRAPRARPCPCATPIAPFWPAPMMHQGWEGLTAQDRLLHAGRLQLDLYHGHRAAGSLDAWAPPH